MSFGFSVGDFVACMLLINDVTQALKSSTGSASEVKALVGQLDSLMLALMTSASIHQQIRSVEICQDAKPAAEAMSTSIQLEYERCKDALQAFKDSLKPYTDAFVRGKVSALTRNIRKITWLFRKDDILKLEKSLDGHLKALSMYRTALSEIYASSTARNSVAILSSIVDLRVEINKISNSIVQQQPHIHQNLGYSWEANFTANETVILLDAIGRTVILPLVLLGSFKELREILMLMYRTIELGRRKIVRNEYTITDENADGTLLDDVNWSQHIQGGMQLTLSMVFPAAESFNDRLCPRCDEQTLGNALPGQRRRCHRCQLTFRTTDRERFVEELEADEPANQAKVGEPPSLATKISDNRIRSTLNKAKGDGQPASREDFMFKSIHYYREIRRLKPTPKSGHRNGTTQRELIVHELPSLHKAAAIGSLDDIETLLATGAAKIDLQLPYSAQIKHTDDWYFGEWEFEGCSPLQLACWYGRIKAIKHLLDRGANIHCMDKDGSGVFHYACFGENAERMFSILLRRGADPSITDRYGFTAFHWACYRGLAWSVQFFLDHGLQLECDTPYCLTPLSFSIIGNRLLVFEVLLDHGANAELRTTADNSTMLQLAAGSGSLQIVRNLLEIGLDLLAIDNKGNTPLHTAAWYGRAGAVEELLNHGAEVSTQNHLGETALQNASWGGHLSVAEILLAHGADMQTMNSYGACASLLAAAEGHDQLLKLLICSGADVDCTDKDGWTALHLAACTGREAVIDMLLQHKASPDSRTKLQETPLYLAVIGGSEKILGLLLEYGADMNAVDCDGYTALNLAAMRNNCDTARFLLEQGADNSITSKSGLSPLLYAADHGNTTLVRMLIDNGAKVNTSCTIQCSPLDLAIIEGHYPVIDMLLKSGAAIDTTDANGRTALHRACFRGNVEVVELLLERGANLLSDNEGRSPLHDASYQGSEALVKILLDRGADPNMKINSGETALHWAANKENAGVVKLLVEAGADVDAQGNDGMTPLHHACIGWHEETFQVLLDAGSSMSIPDEDGRTVIDMIQERYGPLEENVSGKDNEEEGDNNEGEDDSEKKLEEFSGTNMDFEYN